MKNEINKPSPYLAALNKAIEQREINKPSPYLAALDRAIEEREQLIARMQKLIDRFEDNEHGKGK